MTVRYGLIGSGMMGQEHIRNIQLLDDAEVSAISDPDEGMRVQARKIAGRQVATFAHHSDLVSADICDAFVVASPNDTHYAVLQDILPAQKPVLVEKPLCTTSGDCESVAELARSCSTPVWVAMEYRFMPPVQFLMRELGNGTIGRPVMVSIREHRFPFLQKVGNWNRFNRRTGGTMVEKCCHYWDLMRLLANSNPVRVFASAAMDVNHLDETYDGETPDILDNAYAVVDFANGIRGMLDLCMFAEGSHWQEVISVTGSRARIEACVPGPARFAPDRIERLSRVEISDRAFKEVSSQEIEVDEAILRAGDHHGSTYFQHVRFLEMVRKGDSMPEVALEDGLWSVRVGEAAEKSARTGQAIDLGA